MTRLSIATLMTTVIFLTGCDAADTATEEYELLCVAEPGTVSTKITEGDTIRTSESLRAGTRERVMLSTRNIRPRPARLIDSDGETYVGTFSHTDYGVHVTFDRTADVGFSDSRHFEVEGSQFYLINFDLSFSYEIDMYASDEMETNFSEVTAFAEGNCQGQLPTP